MNELGSGRKRKSRDSNDSVDSDWVFRTASAPKAKKNRLQYDDKFRGSEEVGDSDIPQFPGRLYSAATHVGIDGGMPCATVGSILDYSRDFMHPSNGEKGAEYDEKKGKVATKASFSSLSSCREALMGELKVACTCMFQWMQQEMHDMCKTPASPIPNRQMRSIHGLNKHVYNMPKSNPSASIVALQSTPSVKLAATGRNPSMHMPISDPSANLVAMQSTPSVRLVATRSNPTGNLVTMQFGRDSNGGSGHGFTGQGGENRSRGRMRSCDNIDPLDSSYGLQASGKVKDVVNISGKNRGSVHWPELGIAGHENGQRAGEIDASLDVCKEGPVHNKEETGQFGMGLIDCSVGGLDFFERASKQPGGVDLSIQSDISKSEFFSVQTDISRNILEHDFHGVCGKMCFGSESLSVEEMGFGLGAYCDGGLRNGSYMSVGSEHGSGVKEESEFRASLVLGNISSSSSTEGLGNYRRMYWRATPKEEGLQNQTATAEICNYSALNAVWNMRQQGGRSFNSSVPDSELMSPEDDAVAKFGSGESISIASVGSGIRLDNSTGMVRSLALKNTCFGPATPNHAFNSSYCTFRPVCLSSNEI